MNEIPVYLFTGFMDSGKTSLIKDTLFEHAQKNLLLSTMREFKIFVHEDIRTQQKLADILSTYDDMIENNKKQIKLLEEAVQRLYKEWFVDLHFPGWENTTIVDGVPEGWRNATVGDICKLRKETIKADQIPSGLSYIGLEHMPRKDICLADWGSTQTLSTFSAMLRARSSKLFFRVHSSSRLPTVSRNITEPAVL